MYFWTYGLRKTWLDKCVKCRLSEYPLKSNMANRPKHISNQHNSTITIFIDPCAGNSGWKSLSELYAESWDCFLTHWLPQTRILFLIDTIYIIIFRCNYLRNEKHFLFLFFPFSKFRFNFEHFQQKGDSHSWCIFELTDSKKRG